MARWKKEACGMKWTGKILIILVGLVVSSRVGGGSAKESAG